MESIIPSKASPAHQPEPRRLEGWIRVLVVCAACAGLLPGLAGTSRAQGTFYVDAQSPLAADDGPGTSLRPYRTIGGAVAARNGPGVTILVKPGVYREQVMVPASGSSTAPFVLQASGHGVVLDGAEDFTAASGWIQFSGDVWVAPGVDWAPSQVFANGVRLSASGVSPASLPVQSFRYVAGDGLYVNLGGGNPGPQGLMIGKRAYGFVVLSGAWVAIRGFTVTRYEIRGIDLINTRYTQVAGNTVNFAFQNGIRIDGGSADTLLGNIVSDNGDHGIALTSGATGCVVRENESFRNARPGERAANGIYLFQSPGNRLVGNRLHDNQDSGVHLQSGSDNTISMLNRSWNNGDHGFDHLYAAGSIHVGDVAYGNYRDGISIEGYSTGTQIHNCILVNNGVVSDEFNLFVDPNSIAGLQSDYNILWNANSQPPVDYNFTNYFTLAAYTAASGHDVHSLQADPMFVDPAAGDFHLLPGSPAIDSGDSGVPNWSDFDAAGNPRLDEGAVANTGVGPITYGERGALEFAPDRPPVIVAPSALTGEEEDPLTIDVWAADPDGEAIQALTATGLPPGCTFQVVPGNRGGTLQWTPSLGQAGSYTITFEAVNFLTGSSVTSIAVSVAVPNQPPTVILNASPEVGYELLMVTADASATMDSDGTVVTYSFDFGDGTVSGPQASPVVAHAYAAGEWTLRVTASDDVGATAEAEVVVTVNELAGLPNLVANPSFENNLGGWNAVSGAGLSQVSGGHHGSRSVQCVGPSTLTIFGLNDSPNWVRTPAANDLYRISAWVRSATSTGTCRLIVREYQGATRLGTVHSSGVTLSPVWQQVTMDYVSESAGTTLDLQIVDSPVVPGESFQVDDVSVRNVSRGAVRPGAGRPLEATIGPVPMQTSAVISFRTLADGPLQVELFDIAGRRVRLLMRESFAPAGNYRIPFDRARDGIRLNTGVYFYRIRAQEGEATGRFIIVY